MAEGITTKLQKDMNQVQQEISKLQTDMLQIDRKLEDKFESFRVEMKTDLKNLFELFMSKGSSSSGMGILGESPSNSSSTDGEAMKGTVDGLGLVTPIKQPCFENYCHRPYKLECSKFSGEDFQGWILKLEQFFEVERVPEAAKIRTIMLNLEGITLQWHQYFSRSNGGLEKLSWIDYYKEMKERFAPEEYEDSMANLVSLKQTGSVVATCRDASPSVMDLKRKDD